MKQEGYMKKKIIVLFCAAASFAILAGCGGTNTSNQKNATAAATATKAPESKPAESPAMPKDAENPMVGGAPMLKDKDIIDNAVNSKDHTTLVAAVKAAGLVETLKSAGPFTVFAPTNAAFEKLPAGTVDTLLKPENKDKLKAILTYHVVSGKLDAASVAKAIKDGNGKATLKTVQGEEITASMEGPDVIITDAKGGKSKVTIADVLQSNGVIHVVDSVLMPK
jgi:uncharacterized surface protein with fasciclin (FAS1) repeats